MPAERNHPMLKDLPVTIEKHRVLYGPFASPQFARYGMFRLKKRGVQILIVMLIEHGWEHAAVSTKHRPPTREEMEWVKDQFWSSEETVMDLHPPKSAWQNEHPNCHHLWRPANGEIPLPPAMMLTGSKFVDDPVTL